MSLPILCGGIDRIKQLEGISDNTAIFSNSTGAIFRIFQPAHDLM